MIKRRIIEIAQSKCNGCGLCVSACHEGAIGLVDGVAALLRDDYCDGLGDCLPQCPMNAISFVEREALAYDEAAVAANMAKKSVQILPASESALRQWPIQLKLMPINADYYADAELLIAADCTAYSYGSFHKDFMQGKVTIIACPKLDAVDYTDKLASIFTANSIRSITLTRMHVPCCGGLEQAVKKAIILCGKDIPLKITTINAEGKLL